jgi:hypothetical protein
VSFEKNKKEQTANTYTYTDYITKPEKWKQYASDSPVDKYISITEEKVLR